MWSSYRNRSCSSGGVMAVSSDIMRYGGKTRVAAALVVLLSLLVLDATAFSSARSSVSATRGLLDSADTPTTIAVDLMHVIHVNSRYSQGQRNLTFMERVRHSVANSKRRSTLAFTSPLASVDGGAYNMQITVGTPARTFVALADTGSDLLWLQCSPSTCLGTNSSCLQTPDLPFDPDKSSSYTTLPCNASFCTDLPFSELPCPSTNICSYNYSYADTTFTVGDLADETFTFRSLGNSTLAVRDVAFGCGFDDQSPHPSGTDGFVGLGRGPLSLVSQLIAQSIISPVFSYCLVDIYAAMSQTSPLLLGSPGTAAKSYTPLITNPNSTFVTFYYVNLVGITVNGQPIQFPNGTFAIDGTTGEGGIIVDSGTTVTYLFDVVYTPLVTAISALILYPQVDLEGSGFELCFITANLASPVFPTIGIQFENVNLTLGLNNTFVLFNTPIGNVYCFAIFPTGPNSTLSIYGNVQQSQFEIDFDIANQRVGFGPGAC